ncbi:MAG: 2-dehydro-3-deoxy-6-phosphogalactonate aldolase [Rhizobiales bacterium]|nr:2-dehydro-3-deoxy-6-phosphogalactonate aldolase [Hyphomicrobiales bacterium]NRB15432.1 2-dehydro-3-deoxy-6-phosphogalactonate aldolase [Hyphomicrobiales bacterium]
MKKHREIVGILRGVTPPEVENIAAGLMAVGITKIEVPLNSPNAFESIDILVKYCGTEALVGAGTVLNVGQVVQLAQIGAGVIISPNTNHDVIKKTKQLGMLSYPGVMTATECFAAIEAGADALKIFPANIIGAAGISALKAVLPKDLPVLAVGGVELGALSGWAKAGVSGFGLGSLLYKPGRSAVDVEAVAKLLVAEFDKINWSSK